MRPAVVGAAPLQAPHVAGLLFSQDFDAAVRAAAKSRSQGAPMRIPMKPTVSMESSPRRVALEPRPLVIRLVGAIALSLATGWSSLQAGSALELLSGFDQESVSDSGRWLAAPQDEAAVLQAAKLMYQVRRVGPRGLAERATTRPAGSAWVPGDVIELRGVVDQLAAAAIPEDRAEVLEMERLFRLRIRIDAPEDSEADPDADADPDAGEESAPGLPQSGFIMTPSVPRTWLREPIGEAGRRVRIVGVIVRLDAEGLPQLIATPAPHWYPASEESVPRPGWKLLADYGFDCFGFGKLRAYDKQPLMADEPFYEFFSAADRAAATDVAPEPTPAIELLSDQTQPRGRWLRMRLETVRLTKVQLAADEPAARQLGQDHYWQIDAFGKIPGKVLIESEVPGEPPVEFSNRYPVSLVAKSLPPDLAREVDEEGGRNAAVVMLRRPVRVDGFFYRRWSYDTEFMGSQGNNLQFGPLVMVSRLERLPTEPPPDRVDWQFLVAAFFLGGLALLIGGAWWMGRRDRQAIERRRQPPDNIDFPQST